MRGSRHRWWLRSRWTAWFLANCKTYALVLRLDCVGSERTVQLYSSSSLSLWWNQEETCIVIPVCDYAFRIVITAMGPMTTPIFTGRWCSLRIHCHREINCKLFTIHSFIFKWMISSLLNFKFYWWALSAICFLSKQSFSIECVFFFYWLYFSNLRMKLYLFFACFVDEEEGSLGLIFNWKRM